jgi:exoribonuclease R
MPQILFAEIVAIEQRHLENKRIVGHIRQFQSPRKNREGGYKQTYWFYPLNKHYPKAYITKFENSVSVGAEDFERYFFEAKFERWNEFSYNPDVCILQSLGKLDDLEANCKALLREHEVYDEPFGEQALQELTELEKTFSS